MGLVKLFCISCLMCLVLAGTAQAHITVFSPVDGEMLMMADDVGTANDVTITSTGFTTTIHDDNGTVTDDASAAFCINIDTQTLTCYGTMPDGVWINLDAGNDRLDTSGFTRSSSASWGDLSVMGHSGNDTIITGSTDDSIETNSGIDTVQSHQGNDDITSAFDSENDSIACGTGTDEVDSTGAGSGRRGDTVSSNCETNTTHTT